MALDTPYDIKIGNGLKINSVGVLEVDVDALPSLSGSPFTDIEVQGPGPMRFRVNTQPTGPNANKIAHYLDAKVQQSGADNDFQTWNEYVTAYLNPDGLVTEANNYDVVHAAGFNIDAGLARINTSEPMMAKVWEYRWRPVGTPATTCFLEEHNGFVYLGPSNGNVMKWRSTYFTHTNNRATSRPGLYEIRADTVNFGRYDADQLSVVNDPSLGIAAEVINHRNRVIINTQSATENQIISDRALLIQGAPTTLQGLYASTAYVGLSTRLEAEYGIYLRGDAYNQARLLILGRDVGDDKPLIGGRNRSQVINSGISATGNLFIGDGTTANALNRDLFFEGNTIKFRDPAGTVRTLFSW